MTFKDNFLKARGPLVLIAGLLVGSGIIFWMENLQWERENVMASITPLTVEPPLPLAETRPLTQKEREFAHIAWRYFVNNRQQSTGLANSVDSFPATTMWDTSSYLLALISAQRLGIIDDGSFENDVEAALRFLAVMPLFDNTLPNKSYNTISGDMTGYNNEPAPSGIGWSAIDIGRILIPFHILVWHWPDFTASVRQILSRWDFDKLVRSGEMYGGLWGPNGKVRLVQEGRLGYEEYAAKSISLIGLDINVAAKTRHHLLWKTTFGTQIPIDKRDHTTLDAHNYLVSEPFILWGIEFGWDRDTAQFASQVYRAQEARYRETSIFTAVSEGHLDQAPYFVYNTLFANGKFWHCMTDKGQDANQFKTLSIKTIFGWQALFQTSYSGELMGEVSNLYDGEKGWFSGKYEADGAVNKVLSANTNAVILETLCYLETGPLLKWVD